MEAASRAESVNLLDLGTLYLAASGTKGSTVQTASVGKVHVRFTASKAFNEAVGKVEIRKIATADAGPVVDTVTDLFSEKTDGSVTAGKVLRIEGSRLKIAGDDGGVFFAVCDKDGAHSDEEDSWIKSGRLTRNVGSTLEFFIPETLEAGKTYKVLHKSGTKGKEGAYSYTACVLCEVSAG